MVRHLEIDDQNHRLHIDASGSNGGGDEDVGNPILEILQGEVPVALVLAPVECQRRIAVLQQFREHLIDILLLVNEDDDGAVFMPLAQELQEPVELLALLHNLDKLCDIRGRGVPLPDGNLHGLLEHRPGQGLDVGRQGGAEHGHLLVRTSALQEHPDLGLETHVKHPIGLVEDHERDSPEVGDLAIGGRQDVDEPARRPHEDLCTLLQSGELLPHGPAAVGADADDAHRLA
mmetsp:Transcript_64037/g.141093  ORF Transcript_64037/g.141093 Transcript_64037/m.141093 type:complete len:232 (-) Transcript_64037:1160-1855(-)